MLTVFLRLPTCKCKCKYGVCEYINVNSLNFAKATKVSDYLNDHCFGTLLSVWLSVQTFLVGLVTAQQEKLHVQTYFSVRAFDRVWPHQISSTVGRNV